MGFVYFPAFNGWPELVFQPAFLKALAALWGITGMALDHHPKRAGQSESKICDRGCHPFQQRMAVAQREMNLDCLMQTPDLCGDDFLKDDADDVWILHHREVLKKYVDGVECLAGFIPYIETAVGREPHNEALNAMLIRAYLQSGDKAGALQAFNRAETFFRENRGEGPGRALASLAAGICDKSDKSYKNCRSGTLSSFFASKWESLPVPGKLCLLLRYFFV